MAVSPVSVNAAYQAAQRIAAATEAGGVSGRRRTSRPRTSTVALGDALHTAVGTMRAGEAASAQGADRPGRSRRRRERGHRRRADLGNGGGDPRPRDRRLPRHHEDADLSDRIA